MGATAEKIEKVVRDELEAQGKDMPIYHCSSLNEVVNKAKKNSNTRRNCTILTCKCKF